jgi:photosystem II stability/assembly factor-like uncharacterized protein
MKKATFFLLLLAGALSAGYSFAEVWQDRTGDLTDRDFHAITGSRYGSGVYVGTVNGLYRKTGENGEWKRLFASRGEERGVNDIYVNSENAIYIATRDGLYRSRDFGNNWERIFRRIQKENHVNAVACDSADEERIYLGTAKGLFQTRNGGRTWEKFSGVFGRSEINSIALGGKELFAICKNELYKINRNSGNYKKVFSSDQPGELEEDDEIIFSLNDVAREDSTLYLATNRGLFTSKTAGESWIRFDTAGLPDRRINQAIASRRGKSKIYAATGSGVFEYDASERKWAKLYEGMDATNVRRLMISRPGNYMWALCDARVYGMTLEGAAVSAVAARDSSESDGLLARFADEPSVNEVQAMAIRYAEVYPEKIDRWRRGAQYKALLPKVSFGIDQSKSDTYEIYTASTRSYWIYGPEDESEGWDLNFTWDLSDLVWNDSQTSIDVRSKLMVQLRDDIVDEVTRIYFERRRLQFENVMNPPKTIQAKLKRELRIQELTAGLDGLTGSRFSAAL